mmetsp:Transcript_82717/g.146012  ORF Transcript_82717/g.146012 Transcript_82717/m.146012 type:complete len:548 (-) Transcript_82717:89-1732(-)
MPSKRPPQLTDAALGHKKQGDPSSVVDAGVSLTVKNTFIDLPDGAGTSSPSKYGQGLSTAPAQVQSHIGFLNRAMLDSVEETSVVQSEGTSSQGGSPDRKLPPVSSRHGYGAGGFLPGGTPLMTPSPTGSSMFAAARYQLFGGPQVVHEAQNLTSPPGQLPAHAQSQAHSIVHGPVHPVGGGQRSAPLSFAPPQDMAPAPGAEIPAQRKAQPKNENSDEEDADSEAERQQAALAASGRTPENAPKPPPGAEHPSLGSPGHLDGTCKRCCFYPRNRCLNGYECEFCHYDHEKRKRKSKKSKKKKAGDNAEEQGMAYAQPGGMPDYGMMPPAGMPYHHHHQLQHQNMIHGGLAPAASVPPIPTLAEAPLSYQWTDGLPGQTPPPPIMPGYADYLAAVEAMRQAVPPGEPALATNAPPPQPAPYYDPLVSSPPLGYPYDPNSYHGLPPGPSNTAPALEPGWAPPYAHFPPAGHDPLSTGPALPLATVPEGLSTRPDPFAGPAPPPVGSPKLPTDIQNLVFFGEPAPPEAPPSAATPKTDGAACQRGFEQH